MLVLLGVIIDVGSSSMECPFFDSDRVYIGIRDNHTGQIDLDFFSIRTFLYESIW